jgi:T4 RnlA family RNA ligase
MITKIKADKLVQDYETFYCKEQKIKDCDIYIYNYLLSDKDAFKAENNLGTELRGLTIVKENAKENIFLSVPKFFNINETQENQESNLKLKTIKKVSEKLDGSLIQPVKICGEIKMKSKQSFDNQQAQMATKLLESDEELEFFILDCWDNNFYPIFELVGPDNKIVLDYKENKLVLIAVRTEAGEFIDIDKFNYKNRAKSFNMSLDDIIHSAKNDKNIEGYIVKFTDGSIVKIKTLDYLEKHRVLQDADSYKTILKRILEEDMDDLYATIPVDKLQEIQKIEKVLTDYVVHYITQIQDIVKDGDKGNRKAFVSKYISHKYFSVIMSALKGNDVKEALISTILKKHQKEETTKNFLKEIGGI